jgi:peptidoglycan/LPS O-acetylase OafA/YrhL
MGAYGPHRGLAYRPHIDGLRAVAVLGVLLFHFGAPLKGGFVGVDIFYVISGYLIFNSILGDLDAGSFSFVDFYQRRLRRLFPAFAAVTLVVAALSCLFLVPTQLVSFQKSLIAAATLSTLIFISIARRAISRPRQPVFRSCITGL